MHCIVLSGMSFGQQDGSIGDAPEGCGFPSALNQSIFSIFEFPVARPEVLRQTLNFPYNSSEDQDNLRRKGKSEREYKCGTKSGILALKKLGL